eukprot:TRINITY_DN10235_c0_g1_i2.p1 TRINITY_DN10235_c0_g1~~TRINITY_DN10235_c0_g1_i2.p1  ORF type:complete len:483 (+),score=121.66 TRINITY_DN10235_c0_g1_i2:116-1564(+)
MPRAKTQKRMFPLQGGVFANNFSIGLPNVNFMKRRNDYGAANVMMSCDVNQKERGAARADQETVNLPYKQSQQRSRLESNEAVYAEAGVQRQPAYYPEYKPLQYSQQEILRGEQHAQQDLAEDLPYKQLRCEQYHPQYEKVQASAENYGNEVMQSPHYVSDAEKDKEAHKQLAYEMELEAERMNKRDRDQRLKYAGAIPSIEEVTRNKEEPLASLPNEVMLRNYREQIERNYSKNEQLDDEVRDIQRIPKKYGSEQTMEEDVAYHRSAVNSQRAARIPKDPYYGFPKNLNENARDAGEVTDEQNVRLEDFLASPNMERAKETPAVQAPAPASGMPGDFPGPETPARKSPAQQYKEELDRQILLKRQLKQDAESLSRSLDMKVIQKAQAEEEQVNKERQERKRRMQLEVKEVYESQMQERERRRYGRGYRPVNSLEVAAQEGKGLEEHGARKGGDSFAMIHEANREEFKRVVLLFTPLANGRG